MPAIKRYEDWEEDVGPIDFLELVFNEEAGKMVKKLNDAERTHSTKAPYDIEEAAGKDFSYRLRLL